MNEFKSKVKIKRSSEKNFGIVFSIFFLILFIYQFFFGERLNLYLLSITIILIILTLIFPKIFKYPNFVWFKFGEFMGLVISPIIMLCIFIFVFFPIGLIFKILRKDLLNVKINKKKKSYWTNRDSNFSSMKNQF